MVQRYIKYARLIMEDKIGQYVSKTFALEVASLPQNEIS